MATWFRVNIAVTDVYEIMRTIGQGHMGEVYHVRRKETGRTHTTETKKKEEEMLMSSIHNEEGLAFSLDESLRGSLRGSGSRRGRSYHNRSQSSGSLSSLDRSKSPFRSGSLRKSRIAKKNAETLALNASTSIEIDGLDDITNSNNGDPMRKNPPDLSNVTKPKSILKQSSHGGAISQHITDHSSVHSEEKSTGMTALITGKDILDDDDDDDVPMNVNAISQDPPSESENKKPEVEIHATFAEPEMDDDMSAVSDITNQKDSIVTGDIPGDEKKEGVKKWVPRRRVFFRRHYACKTIATENIKKDQMEELMNEIYMMRKMDHPYIIKLYEVYQVDRKSFIW